MFRLFIFILFSSLLFGDTLTTSSKVIAVDESFFTIESNNSIFDTSMSYTHQKLLACQPGLDAVYKIDSSKRLRVIPRKRLESGTTYQCQYGKHNLTIETEPLQVMDYHYFNRNQLLQITFNDTIDSQKAKSYISLQKKDKLATTNLNYTIIQHSKTMLLLKINEPVGDHAVELTINKALSTPQGSSLEETFSASFNDRYATNVKLDDKVNAMSIYDEPRMVALDNGDFAIRLYLDDTLEGTPEQFIVVDGIENFRLNRDNYISYRMREKDKLSENVYYYTDIISSEFQPNSSYTITLKEGLRNHHELKNTLTYTVKSGDRGKGILFDADKPYISNQGELGFKSINLDSATLIVERVLDDNLRYFMNFDSAREEEVKQYTKELFTQKIILDNPKNKITNQKFLLRDLTGELPYGIYKVTMRYGDKEDEQSQSKILFISNLGIAVNLAKDQAFVTVLSLDKAEPVESAKVELYGANNDLLGSVKTDGNGVAIIEKAKLLALQPKGVIVSHDGDKNFLSFNQTIGSPDPETILHDEERFRANVYFQSKLVRPAGKIHALITLKDRDFLSASEIPVKVVLQELYGEPLEEKVYHTDKFGLIDYNHQMDIEDRTGTYELLVKIGDNVIGQEQVKVEAFVPPKIENHITISRSSYHAGELIEANITSSYLFGTPAARLSGKVTLDAEAKDYDNTAYKGYSFTNTLLKTQNMQRYLEQEEEISLDDEGQVSVVLPTHLDQKVPSILEAQLGVTIMDDTTPVAAYETITLYPYEAMVGLKLNANELEKGKAIKGIAVLINPETAQTIDRELYAEIKKVEWHYSYRDGSYEWEKELTTVDSFSVQANGSFERVMNDNGDYIIEIHDHLGGHSASSEFSVWYETYSNISPSDNLKSVEINFEDKLYKKGDTIEATIKAPILDGQLIVTLESDKVLSYQSYAIEKGVAKISFPIEDAMNHGAYLHAAVYRASDTPSQLIPFRAAGYHYVKPDHTAHRLNIKLDVPKEAKSKTTLNLGIQTDKKAKLLISVVDTGILQLAQQEDPKIFEYFDEQNDKQLAYYDLYDQVMAYVAEGKLVAFGAGDGYAEKRKKHLPPDLGDPIKPFMIWSGLFDVQKEGSTIGIDIPEFNGKATIVAIAVNADSIGVETKELIIKDDIMIKPSYPKYILAGDQVDVPVRLFNTTQTAQTIVLDINQSDNLNLELTQKSLTIPANSSVVVAAKLSAKSVGKGNLTILGTINGEQITKTIELPIYNPYTISTQTFKGIAKTEQTFTVPEAYKEATAYITLSDNLIGSMRDDLKYLIGYPYGCAEQTTSKILAMHYAAKFLHNDTLIGESQNFIRQGLKKLRNMQNYYGEFSYWEEGGYINQYASLYAAQTIMELYHDGVEIDEKFINEIIAMLQAVTTSSGQYLAEYDKFHRVYAAFILAEAGKLDESSVNMLLEQKLYEQNFIATYYMAAILKIKGRDAQAQELYDSVKLSVDSYYKPYGDTTGNFESNRRDMFLHFMIKSQYFNKEEKDLASVQKTLDDLYSTQEKAMALKAISLYYGKLQVAKLDVMLSVNGKHQRHTEPITLIVDKLISDTITVTPQNSAMSYSIELVKHLPKPIKNRLGRKKEVSIQREFIDEQGQAVDLSQLVQGETIYSKVRISNLGKVNNVVVSQRIPACMSIINSNIQSGHQKFENDNIDLAYRDIRDDRVLHFINLPKKEEYDTVSQSLRLVPNEGIIYTPLIVTITGTCQLPAVISEAMYDTRIADYAQERETITVVGTHPDKPTTATTVSDLESQAKKVVKRLYYREMQSDDAKSFLPLFNYPVEVYFRKKEATKKDVLDDKMGYLSKWQKRSYSGIQLETVRLDNAKKEAVIKITFDYLLENKKKSLTGTSRHLITLKEIDGEMLITKLELAK